MIKLPNLNNKKFFQGMTRVSFFMLILSILFQVVFTNKYSIKGSELMEYQNQKENIMKEISLLNLEISKVSSMAYLEDKALQLGFIEYEGAIATIGSSQFASAQTY